MMVQCTGAGQTKRVHSPGNSNFVFNDIMAVINTYLPDELSCKFGQISSGSNLKCQSLRLFSRGHCNKKKKNKMSSNRSGSNLKKSQKNRR